LARIATIVSSKPGMRVEVEGNTDSEVTSSQCAQRADAVRGMLIARGLGTGVVVTARGMANSRPLASNSTSEGREQNRRVEIVISGPAIGNLPFWDRTYSLTGQ
jgi:outer membrane protein OmpA-like peptidoglycan-associated protein